MSNIFKEEHEEQHDIVKTEKTSISISRIDQKLIDIIDKELDPGFKKVVEFFKEKLLPAVYANLAANLPYITSVLKKFDFVIIPEPLAKLEGTITCSTNGPIIFINAGYVRKVMKESSLLDRFIFSILHELFHSVYRHPERATEFLQKYGSLIPLNFLNKIMDGVVNYRVKLLSKNFEFVYDNYNDVLKLEYLYKVLENLKKAIEKFTGKPFYIPSLEDFKKLTFEEIARHFIRAFNLLLSPELKDKLRTLTNQYIDSLTNLLNNYFGSGKTQSKQHKEEEKRKSEEKEEEIKKSEKLGKGVSKPIEIELSKKIEKFINKAINLINQKIENEGFDIRNIVDLFNSFVNLKNEFEKKFKQFGKEVEQELINKGVSKDIANAIKNWFAKKTHDVISQTIEDILLQLLSATVQKGLYSRCKCKKKSFEELKKLLDKLNTEIRNSFINALVRAKTAGILPAEADRIIDDLVKSKINWRNLIRAYVTEAILGNVYRTWLKLHRKLPGILPGYKFENVPTIWCLVDTSGSIDENELRQFASEIYTIHNTFKVPIRIIFWDAAAYGPFKAENTQELLKIYKHHVKGGGGTVVLPALNLLLKNMKPEDIVILFSDAEIFDWENPETKQLIDKVIKRSSLFIFTSSLNKPLLPKSPKVKFVKIE